MDPINDQNINTDGNSSIDINDDNEWASLVETLKEERNRIMSILK